VRFLLLLLAVEAGYCWQLALQPFGLIVLLCWAVAVYAAGWTLYSLWELIVPRARMREKAR